MKEHKIKFYDGKLYLNDEKMFLLSGDYPYYRDSKDLWDKKLKLIKELGINVITFYIPWIHHSKEINGEVKYFFNGEFYDNSNLKFFMDLTMKYHIYCIIKPGPFIHAEVKNGGFPDFILERGYPPIVKEDGSTMKYMGKELPNPLNPTFKKETQVWFDQICRNILDDYAFPKGNIIAIQIGNEGIYCNANSHIKDFDYSKLGILNFIDYLKNVYIDIENYNNLHKKNYKSFDEIIDAALYQCDLDYIDWANWSNLYMNHFYQEYSDIFKRYNLPILANLNSPESESLLSSWIARNYNASESINFGFTNWLGNAVIDDDVFVKLALIATLNRWPNLEDNWGHMWAGEEYRYAKTSLYHAVLMLSRGATGYNIYNLSATEHTKEHLLFRQCDIDFYADNAEVFKGTYCAEAPISADAKKGEKYKELKNFITFMKENQQAILESKRNAKLAICYCKDTFAIQAGKNSKENLLYQIAENCILSNTDFDIINLKDIKKEELEKYKLIFICTDKSMPWSMQKVIKELLESEDSVYMVGELPVIDEFARETNCIKNYFINGDKNHHYINNDIIKVKRLLTLIKEESHFLPQNEQVYTVLRETDTTSIIFMINRSNEKQVNKYNVRNGQLKCSIEGKGFMIVMIKNDMVSHVYSSNNDTEVYYHVD